MLFLSYVIGLLFTLRTHAAVIWSTELDEKKHGMDSLAASHAAAAAATATTPLPLADSRDRDLFTPLTRQITSGSMERGARTDIRESQLYQRILRQASVAIPNGTNEITVAKSRPSGGVRTPSSMQSPHIVPPASRDTDVPTGFHLQSLSEEDNRHLTMQVAEMAATAAAVAARDATRAPRKAAQLSSTPVRADRPTGQVAGTEEVFDVNGAPEVAVAAAGGHDAPNWSRTKSAVILLTATVAYAVIAEILVSTVDAVLENVDIDEKFLGITLFALVPNTTEFLV
jgi:Ca2+:H+ antiporter